MFIFTLLHILLLRKITHFCTPSKSICMIVPEQCCNNRTKISLTKNMCSKLQKEWKINKAKHQMGLIYALECNPRCYDSKHKCVCFAHVISLFHSSKWILFYQSHNSIVAPERTHRKSVRARFSMADTRWHVFDSSLC